jgi:septal ring factor EnvC (AmiA/AmiB activator)
MAGRRGLILKALSSLRDERTTLMSMGQLLQYVAATTAIFGAMVGLLLRSMAAQRAELSAKIDGTHGQIQSTHEKIQSTHEKIDGLSNTLNAKIERTDEKIDGLRYEMNAKIQRTDDKIDGLRNEMNARLEPLGRLVDRLDLDVRELSKGIANGGHPHPT